MDETSYKLWNHRYSGNQPFAVVRPANTEAIKKAYALAREHGVPVSVVRGGHSYEGFSVVHGGVVINLVDWKQLDFDGAARSCTFGPGWLQGDLYREIKARGRLMSGGICEDISAMGALLGGGTGLYHRTWGLACDNVLELRVVTPDGHERTCDANRDADLFWACRGAGNGNFGVVIAARVRLYELRDITNFKFVFRWSEETIVGWQHWLAAVGPMVGSVTLEIGAYDNIAPPETMTCNGVVVGSRDDAERVTGGLRQLGPVDVAFESEQGVEVGQLAAGASVRDPDREWCQERGIILGRGELSKGSRWKSTGLVSRRVMDAETALALGQVMTAAPPSLGGRAVAFVGLGGRVDAVPSNSTPYPHRGARYMLRIVARWADAMNDSNHLAYHKSIKSRMASGLGSNSYYFNYCDKDIADYMAAYFADNRARLIAVKHAMDPDNLFRYEQGIPTRP